MVEVHHKEEISRQKYYILIMKKISYNLPEGGGGTP